MVINDGVYHDITERIQEHNKVEFIRSV